jgi:U3 small nucleolar RNA-associated protein 10
MVYRLAVMLIATQLGTTLLHHVFETLGSDSLSFLAGVWTTALSEPSSSWLALVSLRHAYAFMLAEQSAPQSTDFQAIVPAFLVAVSSEHAKVRQAAISCLEMLSDHPRTKPKHIYGFDTLYGSSSGTCKLYSQCDNGP